MMIFSKLEDVIEDQAAIFSKKARGVERDIDTAKYLKNKQIIVVSGMRRAGKSTLLAQFSDNFDKHYYINFDDERLANFKLEDFDDLMMAFKKRYEAKTIFLDEIQNIDRWELFIRRLYEEGYKIFLTGSNAKLLSSELATRLTGRYFKIELYPFSFVEFLKFKKIDSDKKGSDNKILIAKKFDEYLLGGGFPEYLQLRDSEYLRQVYEDVLYKDLLTRFKIREIQSFRQLALFLFSNFTREINYNTLKNTLGFKSSTSVKNYIEFMKESYLFFELATYDYSLKKQYTSNKKIYTIDNGLREAISFSFMGSLGQLLENLVFLELKRRGREIYLFKGARECDFLIKQGAKIVEAIQVTYILEENNRERELAGLSEAMKQFKLKNGYMLTLNQDEVIENDGLKIFVVPVMKWLLLNPSSDI